jgi:serine/threonine-protein kinase
LKALVVVNPTQVEDDKDFPSTLPGTVIGGKYRIDGLIGRGGMGSVWSAVHLGLGQRVAVKLIAKRYASSREARTRFDLEAKAVAQLKSRYVVQVYDNGETDDGTPFIVMELLEGESLDHRIQTRGPMPVDQAVRIVSQVARALMRAHALGIIHRDLKPENIFLTRTEDDDGEIAKVLDFGIAKIKNPDPASDSATRTGAVLGTPLFMSPEQARGLKSVDQRTDLYSLGMVTYMMLTAKPAFNGESFGDILVAICTQPLPSMQESAPWLPPSLDAWLKRACAREPGDRHKSVEELVEGLYSAAGIARTKTQQEFMRSDSAGGSGNTGQVPAAVPRASASAQTQQAASGMSQSNPSNPHTAAPLTVTGEDIPKRSMLIPIAVAGLALGVLGGGAFVVLKKASAEKPTTLASSVDMALAASVSAAPPPAPAPTPPAASVASPTPVAPAETTRPAPPLPQKGATFAKPSGKVPDVAKGVAKVSDSKAPPPAKKSAPDLGF